MLRLRAERLKRGWLQIYVGGRTNIPRVVISGLETGKLVPFPGWIAKLSALFEVPGEELFKTVPPAESLRTGEVMTWLKAERLCREWSLTHVSRLAGVIGLDQCMVSQIEEGWWTPRPEWLAALSRVFRVPQEKLLELITGGAESGTATQG